MRSIGILSPTSLNGRHPSQLALQHGLQDTSIEREVRTECLSATEIETSTKMIQRQQPYTHVIDTSIFKLVAT